MIGFDSSDDDFFNELIDDISDDVIRMSNIASKYAVYSSPVYTGLFKGNWNVSLNSEYNGSSSTEDADGNTTIGKMIAASKSFNLVRDNKIFIQNNVKNLESQESYAATVSFDETTQTAYGIVSGAAITALEGVN